MKVTELLQAYGYSVDEINTAIKEAENKLLQIDGNAFKIKPERESIARKQSFRFIPEGGSDENEKN